MKPVIAQVTFRPLPNQRPEQNPLVQAQVPQAGANPEGNEDTSPLTPLHYLISSNLTCLTSAYRISLSMYSARGHILCRSREAVKQYLLD